MATKTFTQQRATLRPNKNTAFFADDDDDDEELDDDLYSLTDDGSSMTSTTTNADTLVLAQFLATTGPEEFLKPSKKYQQNPQFRRASKLFNRLRKKSGSQGISAASLTASTISSVSHQQYHHPHINSSLNNLNNNKNNSNNNIKNNDSNNNNNKNNNNNQYQQQLAKQKTNQGTIHSARSVQSHQSSEKQQKSTYIPLPVYQPALSVPASFNDNDDIQLQYGHHADMTFLSQQARQQNQSTISSLSSSFVSAPPRPSTTRSTSSSISRRHLSLRDSGVYSDVSEKDDPIPPVPPPSLPAKSQYRTSPHPQQQQQQPKRPAPLPPSVASAAIASATASMAGTQTTSNGNRRTISSTSATSMDHRSVLRHSGSIPAAALKRRSVRVRHIQVQTDASSDDIEDDNGRQGKDENVCSRCHQTLGKKSTGGSERRTSCPSVLPTGQLLVKEQNQSMMMMNIESKQLLDMIEHLKAQLAQEQQSRLKLEQAMSRQQETTQKLESAAREKDRWKGDCLWLNDRIALLPE